MGDAARLADNGLKAITVYHARLVCWPRRKHFSSLPIRA
jgi:hypothetical protein